MELEAASQPERRTNRPARSVRGPVVAIGSLAILFLLGGVIFLVYAPRHAARPSADDAALDAASRGRLYLRIGQPDLAFEAVSGVRDESPAAGEAMAVAGLALIRMGQFRVARMALERALKLKPDQFEAAVTLGELNLDLGNTRRGAEVLRSAVRLRPREYRVWRLLARSLGDLNHVDEAARAYQEVLELGPADRDVRIESLGFLIRSGRSEPVDPWIGQALRDYPDDPAVLGLAARWAFNEHRLEESHAFAERAIRQDPADADALRELARCLIARARWRDALAVAERAVAAVPDEPGTLQLLLMAQTRLGLTEAAAATRAKSEQARRRTRLMAELTEQLDSHPDDPGIRARMGRVALESGSILLAYRCFEAALALEPDHRSAREGLASLKVAHPELARGPGSRAFPGGRPLLRGPRLIEAAPPGAHHSPVPADRRLPETPPTP